MKLSPKAQAALDRVVNKFKQGDLSPITDVVRLRLGSDAPASRALIASTPGPRDPPRTLAEETHQRAQQPARIDLMIARTASHDSRKNAAT